jgi:isoleucyl-tRNA synthetase
VIARLAAPIAPFFMERLFVDLNSVTGRQPAESVHLTNFPKTDLSMIDKGLEERMELAQKISSMTLSLRKKTNIRVRQPLNKILIPVFGDMSTAQIDAVKSLILSEVNVKELQYITDTAAILVKRIKPDFKKLGPRYGKLMKQIAERLGTFTQDEILFLEKNGSCTLIFDGQETMINLTDVEIISEDIPGWQVANMGNLSVALDITITPELWEEGIARELINRIQNLRKDKDFEVTDKIEVVFQRHDSINLAVEKNLSYICSETLARSFHIVDAITGNDKEVIDLTDTISTLITIKKIDGTQS